MVPNRLAGVPLPANTKIYAEVSRLEFRAVVATEATHYMMFDKQAIQYGNIAGLAGNHLYINERAKMIKSHQLALAANLQFPDNQAYFESPIFQKVATVDGVGNTLEIADQGLRDAYNAGQHRVFKSPIDKLATTIHKFVPSLDDFKQADEATADLYVGGARADNRASAVVAFYPVIHTVSDAFWDHKVSSFDQFGNPIIYPQTAFDLSTLAAIAAAEAEDDFDPLYRNIDAALTFNTTLYALETDSSADGYYFRREEPIVRSSGFRLTRSEPLLDFLGMSVCRPHAFFPTQDFYPPFIQDYHMYTTFKDMIKVANATPDQPLLTMELTPVGDGILSIRSRDGFDQETKELQKADTQYPLLERYVTTFATDTDPQTREASKLAGHLIEFETNSGPPKAVFLKLEREVVKGTTFTINQPRLTHVALELYNQDIKSVSDLYETQLYQAVRRNSNYRSDTVHNVETEGCVLLVASDFGNWSRWDNKLRVDNFKGRFIVQFDSESRDRTMPVTLDIELELQPVTLTVVFIYTEYGLVGTAHNNRFRIL